MGRDRSLIDLQSLDEVSGSEGSSEKMPEFSHKGKSGEEVSST